MAGGELPPPLQGLDDEDEAPADGALLQILTNLFTPVPKGDLLLAKPAAANRVQIIRELLEEYRGTPGPPGPPGPPGRDGVLVSPKPAARPVRQEPNERGLADFGRWIDGSLADPTGSERRAWRHLWIVAGAPRPLARSVGRGVIVYDENSPAGWYWSDGVNWNAFGGGSDSPNPFNTGSFVLLTISGGVVAQTGPLHAIAAETGTTDDLVSMSGGATGEFCLLTADTGDTITIKHGVSANQFFMMDALDLNLVGASWILFWFNGNSWFEFFRSVNLLKVESRYVNAPNAAPGATVVAGNAQGDILHSGPKAETAFILRVDAQTAPGASGLPVTWEYGDTNDLDTVATWTTIATLTLSSEKSSSTSSMTNATIPASRLIRTNYGTIVGTPKDATTTLHFRRAAG